MKETSYSYTIDVNDQISFVSDSWKEFARNNGAPELAGTNVIGRSLWDFISDPDTAQIYSHFLEKVRAENETQVVEFRCDSPDTLRLMRLSMNPLGEGAVELVSTTVNEEKHGPFPLLGNNTQRRGELLSMCSWCKKVRFDDSWQDLDLVTRELQLLVDEPPPPITHGICVPCKTALLDED